MHKCCVHRSIGQQSKFCQLYECVRRTVQSENALGSELIYRMSLISSGFSGFSFFSPLFCVFPFLISSGFSGFSFFRYSVFIFLLFYFLFFIFKVHADFFIHVEPFLDTIQQFLNTCSTFVKYSLNNFKYTLKFFQKISVTFF